MNEFDQWMKHSLRVKHYVRYTDDFVVVSDNRQELEGYIPKIAEFLNNTLDLTLHPQKVNIRALHEGIDFLGCVVFPKHCILRTRTKRRMLRKLRQRLQQCEEGTITRSALEQSLQSFLGVLSHANCHRLRERLLHEYWLR